jgi:ferritin-like metal-binding protein YciE
MARVKTLTELLIHQLRLMYDAEHRLEKGLPELADAAATPELVQAFRTHLEETEAHVDRIDQAFELFGQTPKEETCDSMKGIIKDGKDAIALDADPAIKDAALIAAAQEAEHFEIAAYGTLRTWAVALGKTEAVHLFEWTLEEEKETDRRLTQIAESINRAAAATTPATPSR